MEYLLGTESGTIVEEIVRAPDADLHAPALCDVEVAAALRRALLQGTLSDNRLTQSIEDYLDLPLTRHGHQKLLLPMLDLKDNFSMYDAAYVALASQLGGELLTADEGLTRAVRSHTTLATPLSSNGLH